MRSNGNRETAATATAIPPAQPDTTRTSEAYGKLPLSFENNVGQVDAGWEFASRGRGYKLSLKSTEAAITLRNAEVGSQNNDRPRSPIRSPRNTLRKPQSAIRNPQSKGLRMKLMGALAEAQAEAQRELPTKSNYLIGNEPAKWRTNIKNYAQVKYRGVYPGIDLVYYGNQRSLEYDFIIAPGARPEDIRLAFTGCQSVAIGAEGDLLLRLADGLELRSSKPLVYQERDGARLEVQGSYVLRGKNEVGFELGAYDRSVPLVIDPVLVYSTYLDFFDTTLNNGVTVDSSNNVYVTGSDGDNVYVAKLNPAGTAFVYTTIIGGGSGDAGSAVAVNAQGEAYVSGDAYSNDFPVVNAFQSVRANEEINVADSFLFKLDAAGQNLIFSTFLGGTQDDNNFSLRLDAAGSAYVAGLTASPDFPVVSPYQSASGGSYDGYLTKFNSTGGAVYSTYLGGSDDDYALDVAVDGSGNACVTGQTLSTDFPTQTPFQAALASLSGDAFVTKFNAAGSALIFSTYLGGAGEDLGWGIALDNSENVYLTGYTGSDNFPTQNPLQATRGGSFDGFVTKMSAAGSALVYSTYLGGLSTEESSDIFVNQAGAAYVVGYTDSANFPTANPIQTNNNGGADAFISKLNSAGTALDYSTYLGGSAPGPTGTNDDFGEGLAVDSEGNAYIFGGTYSENFPTVNAIQPTLPMYESAFLAKINETGNQTFYTISGYIETNSGNPIADVTVTLTGTQTASVQTTDFGRYSFTGLTAGGNYTVTPTFPNTTFDPLSQTFENLSADQTADFMTAPRTYHINGRITDTGGSPLAGVTVNITGYYYPIERTTDSKGEYTVTYLEGNRQYTVTPSHPTYSFTPLSRSFLLNSNQAADFTATNNAGLSISLTSPADGATFQAPATVPLSAAAASSNSTINKVEFFANAALVGTDTSAPYSFDWTNVAGGTYSIYALVTDARGATRQSNSVGIIVNSAGGPEVQITSPADGASLPLGHYITVGVTATSPNGPITKVDLLSSTVGSEAWNSRDLKSRPH